ncbi:MAG: hypothetical protein QOE29_1301 [Gaiellaceae bacterium]|jgi:hypothetical protein|nr:hypothetical protein [Gaiellaceae bacterium]
MTTTYPIHEFLPAPANAIVAQSCPSGSAGATRMDGPGHALAARRMP